MITPHHLLLSVFGGIVNRIRGGVLNHIPWIDKIDKLIQPYAYMCITANPINFLLMWLGQTPGWNLYIGALGKFNSPGPVWGPIDWLIQKLSGNTILWGWAGLSLRGMLWGSILGIKTDIFALTVTYDFKMPLVGAVMGTTYLVLMRLSILINRKNNKIAPDMGWPWGEYVFGTILWCAALI